MKNLLQFVRNRSKENYVALAVILLVATAGTWLLSTSHAATSTASIEPETGSIAGNACAKSDIGASGGQAVQFGCSTAPAGPVIFPADSGAIFLANAPYNVKCDGTTDNTSAIQSAINTYANTGDVTKRFSFRTLVLPAGTCLITDTIAAPGSAIRIAGAGRDLTIIRLKDNATGYGSSGTAKYVLRPGIESGFNQDNASFANYVQDLTIDVGAGNPGAVGIRWAGSNSAALERVKIRAGTGSGLRGLALETSPGPTQVQDVVIEGFSIGIYAGTTPVNNIVFNNVTLTNQRAVAIQNDSKVLQFENLTVSGAPKVYETTGPQAVIQIIDARFTGPGSGTALNLGASGNYIYVRNVTASGWGNLITTGSTSRFVGKTSITEWASVNYQRGNSSVAWTENNAVVSLNLPHPAAPRSTDYDLTHWKKAAATSGNDTDDDGPAIQNAIDSGAKIVYLPYGQYLIKTPVIVRGNVEKIDFMGSRVADANTGKISVGSSSASFVQLINISSTMTLEQNGPDAMVVENIGSIGATPGKVTTGTNATGDIFFDNVSGSATASITRPVNVYARQTNREGRSFEISGGAKVWMFGDNLEMHDGKGNPYMTISGSTVEILAGAMDNLATLGAFNSTTGPAHYDATNSKLSIVQPGVFRDGAVTGHPLSDVVNGTRVGNVTSAELVVGPAVGSWKRIILPLYVSP